MSSDHGDVLGENGKYFGHPPGLSSDEVLRVPLVMAGPGIPEGRRLDRLGMNVDIVPTLLDFLDVEVDMLTEGSSLVKALRDEDAPAPHEYVFSNIGYGAHHSYVLRTKEFKFEYYTRTGETRLWRLPDQLGRRVDCAMEADIEPLRGHANRRGLRCIPALRVLLRVPVAALALLRPGVFRAHRPRRPGYRGR